MYALDVDDSSDQIKQMTIADIGAFKSKTHKLKKDKDKSKKKKKSKQQSKSRKQSKAKTSKKHKMEKQQSSSSIQIIQDFKPKKHQKRSSSSQSSQQKFKQKQKIKGQKRKPDTAVRMKPDQRFGKQIPANDLIRFGHSTFVKIGKRNPVMKYPRKAKETLKTGVTWWICNGEYNDLDWGTIFCDIYEMQIRDLRITNNSNANILKQIYHVHYDNLQILYLQNNNIRSVQMLSRMRLPILKDLGLNNNNIISLAPMARMGLQNLQILSIADNFIVDMSNFYYLNCNSLKEIYLQWRSSSVVLQDLSWFAMMKKDSSKMNTLIRITVQSKNRIPQKKVQQMICNKYRRPDLVKRKLQ